MNRILLDTNIIIYFLNQEPKVIQFLKTFEKYKFAISIITWIEVLAGSFKHEKNISELEYELGYFEIIPLTKGIGRLTAQILETQFQERNKRFLFQDNTIAATALSEKIPLMTNNPKDFRGFKGLKVISPK